MMTPPGKLTDVTLAMLGKSIQGVIFSFDGAMHLV